MATYKLKKNTPGNYYWILRSDKNYKIIAKSSEAYETRGAMHSIKWVRINAEDAAFDDET